MTHRASLAALARDPLPTLLFGKARAALFGVLFIQPEREFYFRELARATGLSRSSLARELRGLRRTNLVTQRTEANLAYCRANTNHPCYAELKSLIDKTLGVAPQLAAALRPLADRIDNAFIYGSFARGTPTGKSDIDLFVAGTVSFSDVVAAVHPRESRLGRSINPTVYTRRELQQRLAEKHSFLGSVLSQPRIDLIGASDELGQPRQAGRKSRKPTL